MATGWSSEMTIWIAWCEWAGTTPLAWPISRKPPSHRYQRATFNHRYDASFNCWFTGAPVPTVAVLFKKISGNVQSSKRSPTVSSTRGQNQADNSSQRRPRISRLAARKQAEIMNGTVEFLTSYGYAA